MVLALGNRLYSSAPWVPRIAHYPKARLADYFASMVRAFYLHGQHYGRYIGSTSTGFNTRNLEHAHSTDPRAIFGTTWSQFHTGRRTIPRETSHVRAHVLYAVPIERTPINVFFRLSVDNESDPADVADYGPIFVDSQNLTRVVRNRDPRLQGIGANPFTDAFGVRYETFDVELDEVTQDEPGRCQTTVRGYAVTAAAGVARALQPLHTAVYAEMRY